MDVMQEKTEKIYMKTMMFNQIQIMTDSPKGVLQCHFTSKYRVSILKDLNGPQKQLTYIFQTPINALDESDKPQRPGFQVHGCPLIGS